MTLKYRILWFEDDDEVINDTVGPSIISYLNNLGFEPQIVHHINGKKLNDLIQDKNYDLIVTDLNLGEDETGENLIDHVRSGNILTEVLLYSANTTELSNLVVRKGWIERASFSIGLGNLDAKLKEIISLTVRKSQDVNNVRGLVIAETIDLEKKIEHILVRYFSIAGGEELDSKRKDLLQNIYDKKISKHETDIAEIKDVDFTEIRTLIDKDILSASNSFDAIHGILKEKIKALNVKINSAGLSMDDKGLYESTKEELTKIKSELNTFRDEILKIRNTLAHVKEEQDEDGIPYLNSVNSDGTVIKFDNAKYIEIRRNLHKHNVNLDRILHYLE